MNIQIIDKGGEYTLCVSGGPLVIGIPKSVIADAVRAATRARLSGDEDAIVGGFFDVISKGISSVKQVTDNPLIKGVISAIPYGGAALGALELAQAGANLGAKMLAKQPKQQTKLLLAAAKGNPRAKAVIAKVARAAKRGHPAAKQLAQGFLVGTKTLRDVTELRRFISTQSKIPIPPKLIDVEQIFDGETDDDSEEGEEL
jgi:hypothetical protein